MNNNNIITFKNKLIFILITIALLCLGLFGISLNVNTVNGADNMNTFPSASDDWCAENGLSYDKSSSFKLSQVVLNYFGNEQEVYLRCNTSLSQSIIDTVNNTWGSNSLGCLYTITIVTQNPEDYYDFTLNDIYMKRQYFYNKIMHYNHVQSEATFNNVDYFCIYSEQETPSVGSSAQLYYPYPSTYHVFSLLIFEGPCIPKGSIDLGELKIIGITGIEEIDTGRELLNDLQTTTNRSTLTIAQKALNVYTNASTVPVTIKYKTIKEGAFEVTDETEVVEVDPLYIYNENYIVEQVKATLGFSSFNMRYDCVYTKNIIETGLTNTLDRKIRQEVNIDDPYSYMVIDSDGAGIEGATLTVNYNKFQYKELNVRIMTNSTDPEVLQNFVAHYYTTKVTASGEEFTLTFNYAEIQEQFNTTLNWLFNIREYMSTDAGKNCLQVKGESDSIKVNVYEDKFTVTFNGSDEDKLKNLYISLVLPIVEDEKVDVRIIYKYITSNSDFSLNNNEDRVIKVNDIWYSDSLAYINLQTIMSQYGSTITQACNPEVLNGNKVYEPTGVILLTEDKIEGERKVYTYKITYDIESIFLVTTTFQNNEVLAKRYVTLSETTNIYSGAYFVDANVISKDYRVKTVNIPQSLNGIRYVNTKMQEGTKGFYGELYYTLAVSKNSGVVIPVEIVLIDTWHLTINYMREYWYEKNGALTRSPFAIKSKFEGEVKIKDYEAESPHYLTKEDYKKILGLNYLTICDKVDVMTIQTNGAYGVHEVWFDYTQTNVKCMNYDGENPQNPQKGSFEVKVPLTSYAEWCNSFGENWSILYLNKPDNIYFKYTNSIDKNKSEAENRAILYGFFSVAVFEQQISDLNYLFQQNTSNGCVTAFTSLNVQGSKLYEFFGKKAEGSALGSTLSRVGMALCEFIDPENKMYYSYFFYLDCTSDLPYLSLNGADSYDDEDSAIVNKGEDIKDELEDAFGSGWEKFKKWFGEEVWDAWLKYFVFIALGLILLSLVLKIVIKIFSIK